MLKGILAIGGQPGLYKLIAETKNHLIVESLETGKRMPAYTTAKISTLEDIAIFTETEEVPLKEIFQKISEKENGGPAIDHKAPADTLKAFFEEILPDYDRDRVYVSISKRFYCGTIFFRKRNCSIFPKRKKPKKRNLRIMRISYQNDYLLLYSCFFVLIAVEIF